MTPGERSLVVALLVPLLAPACDDGGQGAVADAAAADAAATPAPDAAADVPPDTGRQPAPQLQLTPQQPHDFGTVVVGAMTEAFIYTVSNLGDATADGLTVTLSGSDFVLEVADRCASPISLPAGLDPVLAEDADGAALEVSGRS